MFYGISACLVPGFHCGFPRLRVFPQEGFDILFLFPLLFFFFLFVTLDHSVVVFVLVIIAHSVPLFLEVLHFLVLLSVELVASSDVANVLSLLNLALLDFLLVEFIEFPQFIRDVAV